jgi:hypothetical protein
VDDIALAGGVHHQIRLRLRGDRSVAAPSQRTVGSRRRISLLTMRARL